MILQDATNSLPPDSSFWNIFDHVDKISAVTTYIAELPVALSFLFGLILFFALLFPWAQLLKQFNIADKQKKWWLGGFFLMYTIILVFVKIESSQQFKFNSLSKRVLSEMINRVVSELEVDTLNMAINTNDRELEKLSYRRPDQFHYSRQNMSLTLLHLVSEDILAIIQKKRQTLENSIANSGVVSVVEIQQKARDSKFGKLTPSMLNNLFAASKTISIAKVRNKEYIINRDLNEAKVVEGFARYDIRMTDAEIRYNLTAGAAQGQIEGN